jgi:hypothetical protein
MAQEVKIGVGANVAAGEQAIRRVEAAAAATARTVDRVGQASRKAASDLGSVERAARQLAATQAMLQRELGRPVSTGDAQTWMSNFERSRHGRGLGARRTRAFDGPEEWYNGHAGTFARQAQAEHHRRMVIHQNLQGTDYSRQNPPPPPGGGDEGGAGRGGGGGFQAGLNRARGMAGRFAMAGLALAGVGGVMSIASRGLDNANEENIGTDTLKRKLGDLGADFDRLRTQARMAGDGLGLTYVESNRLAQQYASEVGNLRGGLGGGLRAGIGFSRAYGLDPEAGTQFMGTMRRVGAVGGDEQSNRRLALMIADGVAKGGYGAKADAVLQAVADYSSSIARHALSTPNVGAYMAGMASLTSTGRPGLDPAGAAGILNAADGSVRKGGSYGEAGMNFIYASMRGATPDPLMAKALWNGGLFGTTRNTFGPNTSAGDYYRRNGMGTPGLSDTTNFQRIRAQLGRIAPRYRAEAAQNLLGLSSPQQAMELLSMSDSSVNMAQKYVDKAGITPKASSIAAIARIANARGMGELRPMVDSVAARGDVSKAERDRLFKARDGGNVDELKAALVAVVGTKEQEESEGSKTRTSISELTNKVTEIGQKLVPAADAIRNAVVAVAEVLVPGFKTGRAVAMAREEERRGNIDHRAKALGSGMDAEFYDGSVKSAVDSYRENVKRNGGKDIETAAKPERSNFTSDKDYHLAMGRWEAIDKIRNPANYGSNGRRKPAGDLQKRRERDAVNYFMSEGMHRRGAIAMVANLAQESGMRPEAIGDDGAAKGIAQWHPDRYRKMVAWARKKGLNPNDYWTQVQYVRHEAEYEPEGDQAWQKLKGYGGDHRQGATLFGKVYERHAKSEPVAWRQAHADRIAGDLASNPMPASAGAGPAPAQAAAGVRVDVGAPSEVLLRDATTRAPMGTFMLKPTATPKPAGK